MHFMLQFYVAVNNAVDDENSCKVHFTRFVFETSIDTEIAEFILKCPTTQKLIIFDRTDNKRYIQGATK